MLKLRHTERGAQRLSKYQHYGTGSDADVCINVSNSYKGIAKSFTQVKKFKIWAAFVLCKCGWSFSKAVRCLCNFQLLLVEKLSLNLKGSTAYELKELLHLLLSVPDAVECTKGFYKWCRRCVLTEKCL